MSLSLKILIHRVPCCIHRSDRLLLFEGVLKCHINEKILFFCCTFLQFYSIIVAIVVLFIDNELDRVWHCARNESGINFNMYSVLTYPYAHKLFFFYLNWRLCPEMAFFYWKTIHIIRHFFFLPVIFPWTSFTVFRCVSLIHLMHWWANTGTKISHTVKLYKNGYCKTVKRTDSRHAGRLARIWKQFSGV